MTGPGENRLENVARRYPLAAQAEWRKLLEHFDLATGFAFVVLLVPDSDGAELCRHELQTRLERGGRRLHIIELSRPDELCTLPGRFLGLTFPPEAACLWLGSVVPDYAKDYADWRSAWEFALARLNAYRNPIREHFQFTLIFAGAPWLQEVLREIAPDLWSVRTLVVRIQPVKLGDGLTITTEPVSVQASDASALDPQYALQQAEKLNHAPGNKLMAARLLHRAGEGFAARHRWHDAEQAYLVSLNLKREHKASIEDLLPTLNHLAFACQVLGQTRRSVSYSEQSLAMAREVADKRAEGVALGHLGLAYADLGDARKAISYHEQQLAIARMIGDRRAECAAFAGLGLGYSELGDAHKAIEHHEQQLAIARQMDDRRMECNALGNLGVAYRIMGDIHKAVELYEQALALAREMGDKLWEGNALGNLGSAYQIIGDLQKSITFTERTLAIAREIGDQRGEGSALWNSALLLSSIDRRAEAIERAEAALQIFEAIEDPNAARVRAKLAQWRVT